MKTLQLSKLHQLLTFDNNIRLKDHDIIGIDEAGRGPLCGPVVAAAVILPPFSDEMEETFKRLDDSKKFSGNEKLREELFDSLTHCGVIYSVAEGSVEEIEEHNIYQMTYKTMFKAYQGVMDQLKIKRKHMVLIDGTKTIQYIDEEIPQEAVVKGDGKSASIAAASILAKVHRDRIMRALGDEFPQYNWEKNKGYGTKEHVEAIRQFGRCVHHRKTFLVKGLDYEDKKPVIAKKVTSKKTSTKKSIKKGKK